MAAQNEAKKEILCSVGEPVPTAWKVVRSEILSIGLSVGAIGISTVVAYLYIGRESYGAGACYIGLALVNAGLLFCTGERIIRKLSKRSAPKLRSPNP